MGFVLRLLGSTAGPWMLLGLVVALGGTHLYAYSSGKSNGTAQERAAQLQVQLKAADMVRKAHEIELAARDAQNALDQAVAQAARTDLQNRLAELALLPPKTLIKRVEVKDESGCTVTVPTLGPDFWVRFNAAASGDPEASPPTTGRVRTEL